MIFKLAYLKRCLDGKGIINPTSFQVFFADDFVNCDANERGVEPF